MFEVGEAYESMMGRWSRQLAPLFIDFVGIREADRVLDVGCGTGSLTTILAKVTGVAKIVGIDPSNGFIEYARWRRRANHTERESMGGQRHRIVISIGVKSGGTLYGGDAYTRKVGTQRKR